MLSETDKKFAEAVHIFQNLPQELRPTQEEELEFYGLYKRAVVGQCDIPKPNYYDILSLAKWEAWKKLDDLSMLNARETYVSQLIKLLERFPDRPDVVELLDTFTKLHFQDSDNITLKEISKNSNEEVNIQENEKVYGNIEDNMNEGYQIINIDNSENYNPGQENSHETGILKSKSMKSDIQFSNEEVFSITRKEPRRRSRTMPETSISHPLPAEIALTPIQTHTDEPSQHSDSAYISSSMSIAIISRLRDLEIELSSVNSRVNILSGIIRNYNKVSLASIFKSLIKSLGINLMLLIIFIIILGPDGYNKLLSRMPQWVINVQANLMARRRKGRITNGQGINN